MKRATAILFALAAAAALYLAFVPVVQAQQPGILERIEAKLEQCVAARPTCPVPPVDPVTPKPVEPAPLPVTPATGGPSCNPAGSYHINGPGTLYNVCACPSATVQLTNMAPWARISFSKMPGTGLPTIPKGIVTLREGARVIGNSATGGEWGIGLGDRAITFSAEACTNLVVQVL